MTRVRYVAIFGASAFALAWFTDERDGIFLPIFWSVLGGFGWARGANERRVEDARLIGSVDPDVWYPVHEALLSGELPADRSLDAPLGRLVDARQRRLGGLRSWSVVSWWAVAVVVAGAFGVIGSAGWFLIATVVLVGGPVARCWMTRQARRLDRLEIGLIARAA